MEVDKMLNKDMVIILKNIDFRIINSNSHFHFYQIDRSSMLKYTNERKIFKEFFQEQKNKEN